MIRIVTVAAVAALVAAPANAQTLRVATTGKSAQQLQTEIVKAAKSVCARASMGASFPREMMAACMKASIAHAVAQSGDPALAALPAQFAGR